MKRRKLSIDAARTCSLLLVLVLSTILVLGLGGVVRAQEPQVLVTFSQSGVGGDFTGTVVTIDGTDNLRVSDLPKTYSFDNNSQHVFIFNTELFVNSSMRYEWTSTTGEFMDVPGLVFIPTQSETITASYKTQRLVTFNQTGVGPDFAGPLLTVDGANYYRSSLPINFWFDSGSTHSFAYISPLVVNPFAKQYAWKDTTGPSTLQSGSLAVAGSGIVTGVYKTQYHLSMVVPNGTGTPLPGSGFHDAGSKVSISITPTTQYMFQLWLGIGTGSYSGFSISASVTMNGSITEAAFMAKKITLRFY